MTRPQGRQTLTLSGPAEALERVAAISPGEELRLSKWAEQADEVFQFCASASIMLRREHQDLPDPCVLRVEAIVEGVIWRSGMVSSWKSSGSILDLLYCDRLWKSGGRDSWVDPLVCINGVKSEIARSPCCPITQFLVQHPTATDREC